jgi:hypothetical protein
MPEKHAFLFFAFRKIYRGYNETPTKGRAMNRADKIALAYVGTIATALIVLSAKVIDDQTKEISRLKRTNKMLHETVKLMYDLNTGKNVKNEVIDHVIKYSPVPDDIRDLK